MIIMPSRYEVLDVVLADSSLSLQLRGDSYSKLGNPLRQTCDEFIKKSFQIPSKNNSKQIQKRFKIVPESIRTSEYDGQGLLLDHQRRISGPRRRSFPFMIDVKGGWQPSLESLFGHMSILFDLVSDRCFTDV